jgi:hypothetical protein
MMRRSVTVAWLGLAALAALRAHPVRAADYHVSAAGDDARDGTAPERAWRTAARASRQALRPGDRLLFRGGDAFAGNLHVKSDGAPSAASPIVIGSYGPGRATIRAGHGTGVTVENTGGLVIRDLLVEGEDRRTNQGSGVSVLNTLSGAKQLAFVRIENVEARGFGKYGLAVGGWPPDKSRSGFRDVRISGCRAADNAYAGIHVFGVHDFFAKTYAHRDVAVLNCVAENNPGDPEFLGQHSGNGILLHDVDGGLIDGCTARGNGRLCRATSGGPVGIWAWSARKLVIQNCVSVRNRTGGKYDGGGFDFDGGVSESVMQYNYSAENDGAGFLVFDFGAAPFRLADNVIRFNISENDGRKNGYAGVHVDSAGAPIERLHVYHNTVFVGPADGAGRPPAAFIHKAKDSRLHNNLFIAAGGCALADVGGDEDGLLVQGNHYWAADGAFLARRAGRSYSTLTEWRTLGGLERRDGQDVGTAGDPLLTGFGPGDIVSDARQRTTLDRYKLRKESPLGRSALDLKTLFNINPGGCDFWGNRLPKDATPAVGAHAGWRPGPPGRREGDGRR